MPVGWAWAMNAPFQWTKQVASPLRRHAQPAGRPLAEGDQGEGRDPRPSSTTSSTWCRRSWRRASIPEPSDGQRHRAEADRGRVDALLLRRRIAPRAGARRSISRCSPTGRSTTTAGSRAAATACPGRPTGRGDDFLDAPWELYNIDEDFSQANDLAAEEPGRSSRSCRPGSSRRPRSTTCFRSTRGSSERLRPEAARRRANRGRAGPTTATTSGCRSRSVRSSSRAATRSPPS